MEGICKGAGKSVFLKYRPEAVYVEGNAFETYPVIRALRKKHIPVLTMIENKEKKIMVRIP